MEVHKQSSIKQVTDNEPEIGSENFSNSINIQSIPGDLVQSILPNTDSMNGDNFCNNLNEINQEMIDNVFNNFYE